MRSFFIPIPRVTPTKRKRGKFYPRKFIPGPLKSVFRHSIFLLEKSRFLQKIEASRVFDFLPLFSFFSLKSLFPLPRRPPVKSAFRSSPGFPLRAAVIASIFPMSDSASSSTSSSNSNGSSDFVESRVEFVSDGDDIVIPASSAIATAPDPADSAGARAPARSARGASRRDPSLSPALADLGEVGSSAAEDSHVSVLHDAAADPWHVSEPLRDALRAAALRPPPGLARALSAYLAAVGAAPSPLVLGDGSSVPALAEALARDVRGLVGSGIPRPWPLDLSSTPAFHGALCDIRDRSSSGGRVLRYRPPAEVGEQFRRAFAADDPRHMAAAWDDYARDRGGLFFPFSHELLADHRSRGAVEQARLSFTYGALETPSRAAAESAKEVSRQAAAFARSISVLDSPHGYSRISLAALLGPKVVLPKSLLNKERWAAKTLDDACADLARVAEMLPVLPQETLDELARCSLAARAIDKDRDSPYPPHPAAVVVQARAEGLWPHAPGAVPVALLHAVLDGAFRRSHAVAASAFLELRNAVRAEAGLTPPEPALPAGITVFSDWFSDKEVKVLASAFRARDARDARASQLPTPTRERGARARSPRPARSRSPRGRGALADRTFRDRSASPDARRSPSPAAPDRGRSGAPRDGNAARGNGDAHRSAGQSQERGGDAGRAGGGGGSGGAKKKHGDAKRKAGKGDARKDSPGDSARRK
jgi:hypothetical protein